MLPSTLFLGWINSANIAGQGANIKLQHHVFAFWLAAASGHWAASCCISNSAGTAHVCARKQNSTGRLEAGECNSKSGTPMK